MKPNSDNNHDRERMSSDYESDFLTFNNLVKT